MVRYIDGHGDQCAVEPICKVLPIVPSTHHVPNGDVPPADKKDDNYRHHAPAMVA